jgi:transposase
LDPDIPVALEATFGWPWVADLLEELHHPVHLGHPPVIRALAKHEAKTDRCDGDRLGKFQLRGILPESYLAPPEVRQRRERTRYRTALVALRTGIKNRVQAILHRLGILHPFSDLFGKAGRRFLDDLPLPEASRQVLKGYLDVLDVLTRLIQEVEQWMEKNLEVDDLVRLLMTIPGIGLILAHVIRSEIGEIERFPTTRHLASYGGLAPMSDDTAGREGPRHCSAACNHFLRWALIEAVHGVQRTKGTHGLRLRKLYARLSAGGKKGAKASAKVAVAHELSKLVHGVWTKHVPYTDTPPPRPGSHAARCPQPQEFPTATTTLRPDQPRHPMVRRRPKAVGQTRL